MANRRDEEFPKNLVLAAERGRAAEVIELLNEAVSPDLRDDREATRGRTPLMLAAEAGQLEVVQALLAAGADVNATDDPEGKPARGLAFVLREGGLDALSDAKYRLNRSALMFAAGGGQAACASALLAGGAKVNQKDYAGSTALHWAARYGHLEAIRALLAAGAKVDQPGPNRQTAISWAVEAGSSEAVRALLEKGASVTQIDTDGRSALDVAAANGSADLVRSLLEALADGPEKSEALSRALTFAVRAKKGASEESILGVAEQLVAAGARAANRPAGGAAPLDTAAINGFERVAAMLLDAGAEVDATDPSGMSALLSTVLYHRIGVARLLLERGADPNLRDENGKSVLEYARERAKDRRDESIYTLLKQGAVPPAKGKAAKDSAPAQKKGNKKKQLPRK